MKHKSKTKSASEAIVSVRFKEKRYPNVQPSQLEIQKSVQLPDWVELKSIKAEGDLLTIRATTTVGWASAGPDNQKVTHDGVHWLAMMFMNLYQHLNRASR